MKDCPIFRALAGDILLQSGQNGQYPLFQKEVNENCSAFIGATRVWWVE